MALGIALHKLTDTIGTTIIFTDNQAAISLSSNPTGRFGKQNLTIHRELYCHPERKLHRGRTPMRARPYWNRRIQGRGRGTKIDNRTESREENRYRQPREFDTQKTAAASPPSFLVSEILKQPLLLPNLTYSRKAYSTACELFDIWTEAASDILLALRVSSFPQHHFIPRPYESSGRTAPTANKSQS